MALPKPPHSAPHFPGSTFLRHCLLIGLVMGCAPVPFSLQSSAQAAESMREVIGKVVDKDHQPVKGAVVQLENETTQSVATYITDSDGAFHFKRVSANDNFKVSATFNGATSRKHEISRFDSKAQPFVTLVLP